MREDCRVDTLELLAHPARMRIVHAMSGGQVLTTGELCELLPDLSKATVYRHVEALAAGGILEVASERRVRGAMERGYQLHARRAVVDAETAASATRDDHRRVFATAMAVLISEFNSYLDQETAAPVHDLVGYRQHALWLSRDELEQMIVELRQVITPRMANRPEPDRGKYLLSPIIFPLMRPDSGDDGQP